MGLDGELDASVEVARFFDLRFVGQAHELSISYTPEVGGEAEALAAIPGRFRARYRELYGIESDGPVEYAAFRVRLRIPVARAPLPKLPADDRAAPPVQWREVHFGPEKASRTRILSRSDLALVGPLSGPALVESDVDTVVVPPGWSVSLDAVGSVHLRRETR